MINRGNSRKNLFEGEGAAEGFEKTLGEAVAKFGWRLHAYVIMRNHFHLALELTESNLSHGMRWLQATWTHRFVRLRRSSGRIFQDRFKALIVEPGPAFGKVCDYIHLNPVRAGVVKIEDILSHSFSSLPKFSAKKRPEWLTAKVVLSSAGDLPDNKDGWRRYRSRLEFLCIDEESERELVSRRLSRGWCVGEKAFRREIREEMATKGSFLQLGRFAGLAPEDLQTERIAVWEGRLRALASVAKIDLGKLPIKKSAAEKVLLAAAMKQTSSVSNGWLAERLQMGQPATVSQFVRRWLIQPKKAREVATILSRVKA